jgi:hypothetical protein
MDLRLRDLEYDRKHGRFGRIAEAGHLLQRLLRFDRQAAQLAGHEVDDIVGVALGVDAPRSQRQRAVPNRGEQALGERVKKLNQEERVAGGLLLTSCASGADRSASQCRASAINCPRSSRASGSRRISARAPARRIASSLRINGRPASTSLSRWRRAASGAAARPGQQILQQIERRRVEPLQIVEEQDQRMFRRAKTPIKRRNTS